MNPANLIFSIRHKNVWSNPKRQIQTLESFSQTEIDAGESILSALPYVKNKTLRKHMERHAKDELRHGMLFRTRAQELRKLQPNISSITKKPDKLYNLSREKTDTELNSHDFFSGESFEKLGEIMYVAMLNIAEKKAEKTFSKHHKLVREDPNTYAIFEKILKDERYHVSYTSKFLHQWKKEGKEKQVRKAVSFAKRSRFVNAFSRKSAKFGEFMGHFILYLIYFTVIVPFAIASKLSRTKNGWHSPQTKLNPNSNQRHSQY
jgi:rubrerythrin